MHIADCGFSISFFRHEPIGITRAHRLPPSGTDFPGPRAIDGRIVNNHHLAIDQSPIMNRPLTVVYFFLAYSASWRLGGFSA
jgi:hypothetical protein